MTRDPLTRADVVKILGDVDETTIAELLSSGATVAELVVALERFQDRSRYPDGAIGVLCEILSRWRRPHEPEYLGTD